jgi:hypothetical protein
LGKRWEKQSRHTLKIDSFEMLDSKPLSKNQEPDYRGNGYNENVPKKEHLYPEINIDEDEIPFSQG